MPADSAPTLVIVDPNGRRAKLELSQLPFRMGRAPDSQLMLRDSRVSRNHAQIVRKDGRYVLEDLGSLHGVRVNGEKIRRSFPLEAPVRIDFGVPDGYEIHFTPSGEEMLRLVENPLAAMASRAGTANLEKLRAVLEVARSLQSSFSVDDVLNTVLDAAMAVTGAERGFLLLLEKDGELKVRRARSSSGGDLAPDDLRIPRRLIQLALESRHDLFSMSFDPSALDARVPGNTIGDLELRSVVCVPLVQVKLGSAGATRSLSTGRDNAGVLYMDSRAGSVDLTDGNRELLQTLAIDASTVLENARQLEEERARQRMEEELDVARRIQQSLLPRKLPEDGWFVVSGSSEASHQVGGDYFDVVAVGPETWSMVVADVSGKGVSSALLAGFLQGAFLSASSNADISEVLGRINVFLSERAEYGKYATIFYSHLDIAGRLTYANAGHAAPLIVPRTGKIERLEATSMPVGLAPSTQFGLAYRKLSPGDRIVLYTDGVTEAANEAGEFFGRKGLVKAIRRAPEADCASLHREIQRALFEFTAGADQSDDLTLVVVEYRGP